MKLIDYSTGLNTICSCGCSEFTQQKDEPIWNCDKCGQLWVYTKVEEKR